MFVTGHDLKDKMLLTFLFHLVSVTVVGVLQRVQPECYYHYYYGNDPLITLIKLCKKVARL